MIPIVSGAITGAALLGSVITGGAIANRQRKSQNDWLAPEPSYVDRLSEFQTANAEYEQMLKDFECTLTPKQQETLLRLKVKANNVQIKWSRLQSTPTISSDKE